jgi:integrase
MPYPAPFLLPLTPLTWRHGNVISRAVRKIRKTTGIKDFTFHQLRHTASTFVAEHSSLGTAKEILGHQDIKTTLKYTHPALKEKRRGVTKLETHLERLSRKSLINK